MVRRPDGCPPAPHPRTALQGDPVPGTNLTREEAATRAALVTVTGHDVDLDVTTGPETFSTRSTIRFTCTRPGAETFLDFLGGTVEALTVNGTEVDPAGRYADS